MSKKYQDKRMNIMVNKIGLLEEKALWCLNKSKKYSVWLANQMKDRDLTKSEQEIDLILDWKKEIQEINLNEETYISALTKARQFQQEMFVPSSSGLKNTNVVLDCGEYKWVKLETVQDCKEEGSAMGHCIGNKSHSNRISTGKSIAFSLRDKFNVPHLTLEANSNDRVIFEFKGSSNSMPKSKYIEYFLELFKKYNFGGLTDYHGKHIFMSNTKIAEKINEINDTFFDFDFKVEIGLEPFVEGEIYVDLIQINTSLNTFKIPDNTSFYNTLSIQCNNFKIGNNVLIGGDLSIKGKAKLGNNIRVGGNVFYSKENDKKEIEKVLCFGEKKLT